MIPDIWEPDTIVVFAGAAVDAVSESLGFYPLHPRNRLWELLELGGITPARIITAAERKALIEGHERGNVADPVRALFMQKKTSQLIRLGIGITTLNRRTVASNENDKAAKPDAGDVESFLERAAANRTKILALAMVPDLFVALFKGRCPDVTPVPGPQPCRLGEAEVWLLGSPVAMLRGEALTAQEDAFVALGERLASITPAVHPER